MTQRGVKLLSSFKKLPLKKMHVSTKTNSSKEFSSPSNGYVVNTIASDFVPFHLQLC